MTTLSEPHVDALFNWVQKSKESGMAAPNAERNFGAVLALAETLGMAGFMAYANAKYGKNGRGVVEVGGIPADVVIGVIGTAVGFSGYLGKYSEHAHSLANGFLAAYLVRLLMMWGADARMKNVVRMNAVEAQRASSTPAVGALPAPRLGTPYDSFGPQHFMQTVPQPEARRTYSWEAAA